MEDIDYLTLNKKEEAIILEALDDSRYSNISSIRKFMLSGDEDLIPYCENKIIEIEKLKINILKQLNKEDLMGYYIEANMSFTGATAEEVDLITSYIEENEDDFYLIYPNGESKTEGKWYDRDVHFKTLSLKFPNVLFNLYCCGEDGVKWLEYYKDGVYKRVEAIITYNGWED